MNENDFDFKVDYDPTQTSSMANINCDLTYKQIFFETLKFVSNNNNPHKPYLEYPKLYLNSTKPKCDDKIHCKQCYGNQDVIFCLCSTLRRRIADKLYDCGQQQQCASHALRTTTAKL